MSLRTALGTGVVGALVVAVVDPFVLPLAAVTAGALVTVAVTRLLGSQDYFDAVGASFALSVGAVLPSITLLSDLLAPSPRLALVVFGTLRDRKSVV